MRVYLSVDMEGVAGVVEWDQCRGPGARYDTAVELLLGEVNAAIEGAVEAGATEIVVNDSHGAMSNLPPHRLAGGASYLSGSHKPLYMMEGLDASFDAVLYLGYHGSAAAERAVLPHTYNPLAIAAVHLAGAEVGESGVNALVAAHHGVPVVLVTGDRTTVEETRAVLPGCHGVVVKESLSAFSARSLHPEAARRAVHDGAREALLHRDAWAVPDVATPVRLDVTLRSPDLAEQATWVRGVERTGRADVAIVDEDRLRAFRTFITVVVLTRELSRK